MNLHLDHFFMFSQLHDYIFIEFFFVRRKMGRKMGAITDEVWTASTGCSFCKSNVLIVSSLTFVIIFVGILSRPSLITSYIPGELPLRFLDYPTFVPTPCLFSESKSFHWISVKLVDNICGHRLLAKFSYQSNPSRFSREMTIYYQILAEWAWGFFMLNDIVCRQSISTKVTSKIFHKFQSYGH